MTILIASDHAGYDLKEFIKKHLRTETSEIQFEDLGTTNSQQSVDYPDYAAKLCEKMPKESPAKNPTRFGILVCGSGQGMAIKANKYAHIRAAECWDNTSTRLSREHNNANVLCMGGRMIPYTLAIEMVKIFIKTEFANGRHENRVNKLC